MEEHWILLASILPSGIELKPISEDECTIENSDNSVSVIRNDEKSYVVNGKTLSFEDTDEEIINTLLVPYILQELDGNRRM